MKNIGKLLRITITNGKFTDLRHKIKKFWEKNRPHALITDPSHLEPASELIPS